MSLSFCKWISISTEILRNCLLSAEKKARILKTAVAFSDCGRAREPSIGIWRKMERNSFSFRLIMNQNLRNVSLAIHVTWHLENFTRFPDHLFWFFCDFFCQNYFSPILSSNDLLDRLPRFQMTVWRKLKGNDAIMTQTACCILASTMLYNDWYISTSTYLLIFCLLHLVWTIIWPNLFLLPVYRARCSSPHNADHPSLLTYLPCVNIITATRSSHSLPRTRNRLDSGHDRAALSPCRYLLRKIF